MNGMASMMHSEDRPSSFVVAFFYTRADELRCRVTEVGTQETWIAPDASSLRQLLLERLDKGSAPAVS